MLQGDYFSQAGNGRGIHQITGKDGRSAASLDNFFAHLVQFVGAAGKEQHVRSHRGEAARNGFSGSAGGASHDSNVRFESIHHVPFDAATGKMAFNPCSPPMRSNVEKLFCRLWLSSLNSKDLATAGSSSVKSTED
jgi:hypothetical protein